MSKLDKMFHKHLEKIRNELNTYINRWYCGTDEHIPSASTAIDSEDKKPAGVTKKFVSFLQMFADDEEDDFAENYLEEEDFVIVIPRKPRPEKSSCYKSSQASQKPSIADDVGQLNVPDFLIKQEHHQEIDKVLEQRTESFSAMLLRLIDEKGLKDSEVYKRANIDRRLFSKIRGDEQYVPSKKTAISFCLALQLELNDAKRLLETAGYTLSASSKFDLIIMYLIENNEYNIHFANIVLDDYGEGTLSR